MAQHHQQNKAVVVTAVSYSKDYHANEVSDDNKYKGKNIEVTGTVEDISKDFMDNVYISPAAGEAEMGVQCFLTDAGKAAELSKGQKVTLVGEGNGYMATIPQVKDCVIK